MNSSPALACASPFSRFKERHAVDTGVSTTVTGDDLLRDKVAVQFGSNRMSALLFIEAAN